MINYKLLAALLLSISCLLILSCEDFLEVEPKGQLSTELKSTDDAILALNAAYSALTNLELYNGYDPITELWGDDTQAHPDLAALNQIHDYTAAPDNRLISAAWIRTYEAIFRANIVLEATPDTEGEAALKSRIIGEAHFIRGVMMMRLAIYWGTAPLVVSVAEIGEFNVSNSTPELLWAQAISDLTAATTALPDSYGTSDTGRATKGAAFGFLGKAYLFNQEYQMASTQFDIVEGLGYSLLPNFADVFLIDNSAESIFEIQFASGFTDDVFSENALGSHQNTILPPNASGFGGGGGWGFLQPLPDVVDAFDPDDPRRPATFFLEGDSFEGVEFPESSLAVWPVGLAKYTRGTDIAEDGDLMDHPHNWIWLRYADLLLMHAEALIELNQVDLALEKINMVRRRAGVPDLVGLSQSQARDALRSERRVELAFEAARGVDIRRWGIATDVLGDTNFKPGVHEVLPIPQFELDNNPNLTQNVGY